jgi:ATP-dependent Clp protease ATP-binding subunit ClpA
MFEKFPERARRVMGLARQEAQRLGSEFIGTEHILLGMLQEGGSVAARVLVDLGVDYKGLRQQIEKLVSYPQKSNLVLGHLPFSPRSKKALELAAEAANELGHDLIGTEHLLIGLVGETEGIAAMALTSLGLNLEDVRRRLLEAIGAPPRSSAAVVRKAPWSDRTRRVVLEAVSEAEAARSSSVEPEHLVLAILKENGPAGALLSRSGVTKEAVIGILPPPQSESP